MTIDIRKENYLPLLRRQIEKQTGEDLEAQLTRTEKTLFVEISEDYEVLSYHWGDIPTPIIEKQEEAQDEEEIKAPRVLEKHSTCKYCGDEKKESHKRSCEKQSCKEADRRHRHKYTYEWNAKKRYSERIGRFGFDKNSLQFDCIAVGDEDYYYDDYSTMLNYIKRNLTKATHFIVVPYTLYLYGKEYFDTLKYVKVCIMCKWAEFSKQSTKELPHITCTSCDSLMSKIHGIPVPLAQKVKVLGVIDSKTIHAIKKNTQSITFLPPKSVKSKTKTPKILLNYFNKAYEGCYKRIGY